MNHTPAYSIDRYASKRQNGMKMYDMFVRHAIGIDEIAYAIHRDFDNKINNVTRKGLLDAVASNLRFGLPNEGGWDGYSEKEMEEAYRIARVLFPELSDE